MFFRWLSKQTPAVAIAAVCFWAASYPLAASEDELVVWGKLVNTAADAGGILKKTGGCDGCPDAGASSTQHLESGDGYVEFTIGEATTFFLAGLSHGDDDTAFADIDFAFRFNGVGTADVMENGVYKRGADTPYVAGDVFRIAVVKGRVQYSRNGVKLMDSTALPSYPLGLDVTLGSAAATVRNARIALPPHLSSSN